MRALKNGLRAGKPAHAYLFCGPRGTGKTSTARLLAKTLNCQNPQDGEPCNICLNCREITEGRSLDVIEIDAASNRGIDEIRNLREKVAYGPGGSRYKVYVLDEAHMLTTEACNALLKTLEEPPPHVIFVLATTEAHRILPTIVSRCLRFDFRRFSLREIMGRLQYVAQQEGWSLEPGAAELLARAAAGGMRDALSLLDRAVATLGTAVTTEGVQQMLGLADPRLVRELVEHVAHLRGAEGLHLINRLAEAGADLRQLSAQVADYWRALMLAKAGADLEAVLDRSPEDAAEIGQLAGFFALDELSACARLFSQNDVGARSISIPQLAVELAFVDCLHLHRQRASGAEPPPPAGHRPVQTPGQHPAPATQPAQRPPVQRSAPLTSQAIPEALPGSVVSLPTMPDDHQSLSSRPTPMAEERWSFDEEAPEPLIPELRSHAAGREASPAFSGVSAQASAASAPPPAASHAPAAFQSRPAPLDEDAGWADESEDKRAEQTRGAGAVQIRVSLSEITRQWEMVKKACKTRSNKLAALLNNAYPVAILPESPPTVAIQVDFEFHYKRLIEPASREIVAWALGQILEMPCQIQFLQKDEPIPASSTFVTPSAPASATRPPQRPAPAAAPPREEVQPSPPPETPSGFSQPPVVPVAATSVSAEMPAGAVERRDATHGGKNGFVPEAAAASPLSALSLAAPQNAGGAPRQMQPPADLLKEMVLRDPVVDEVIRTYDARLVEWKRLEE